MEYEIHCEKTPNPQSLKFVLNQTISEESVEITSLEEAGRSPLAKKILGFPWAKSVFIGSNFISVNKEEWVDWEMLEGPLSSLIKEHLEAKEGVLLPKARETNEASATDQPEDVQKIKSILEQEIQPAVAMDGGYISFVSYKDKKVYLKLQGACAGCPSSAYTLKEGIETRLKQSIPDIEEVISI